MGKNKGKKKGKGAEKTAMKTDKKLAAKQKKLLEKIGEADITEIVAKAEAEQQRLTTITMEVCPPPSPRSSFTFIAHPEKEELIMFGGEFYDGKQTKIFNDLFFYNIGNKQWKQLCSPSGPAPRSGHQMVALPTDGGKLWLFGGEYASPSQEQFFHFRDLWCLCLKTRKWNKVTAPNGPSARSGHRMTANKKSLVVFGGFHDNNRSYQYFNDVHVFSLESYTWIPIEISGAIVPQPRSACCMATCPNGKILVWGGYSKTKMAKDVDKGFTHTDMFFLSPSENLSGDNVTGLNQSNSNNKKQKYKWITVKPSGYKPHPRSSVGSTVTANGKAICFGGMMDVNEDEDDLSGQASDELLSLDLNTQKYHLLSIKSLNQSKSDSKGNLAPSPRMSPGMAVCKGKLYLFGGVYEDERSQRIYNDLYALDLHKLEHWDVLIPNENAFEIMESSSEEGSSDEDDIDTREKRRSSKRDNVEDMDDDEEDDDDDDDDDESEGSSDEMSTD